MGNPVRTVFDSAGRQMAANDKLGNINPGSELSQVPGVPNHPSECALVLVLPPGTFRGSCHRSQSRARHRPRGGATGR